MSLQPKTVILIGFLLVLLGVVAPLLMVLDVLESTFFLNFLSFAASVAGLFLGIIGAASYTKSQKKQDG